MSMKVLPGTATARGYEGLKLKTQHDFQGLGGERIFAGLELQSIFPSCWTWVPY